MKNQKKRYGRRGDRQAGVAIRSGRANILMLALSLLAGGVTSVFDWRDACSPAPD